MCLKKTTLENRGGFFLFAVEVRHSTCSWNFLRGYLKLFGEE